MAMAPRNPTDYRILPKLDEYCGNGINVMAEVFVTQPVFELTYASGVTKELGARGEITTYKVPDGLTVETTSGSMEQSETAYLKTEEDYNQYMSLAVQGEFSGPTISGKASAGINTKESRFRNNTSNLAISRGVMQVFTVSRYTTSGLTKAFQAAVAGLPKQANCESDIRTFRDFFDDFGTHYLRSAAFGGYFTIKTEFTESLLRSYGQRDLRAAVDASYKGVVSSGRMSADAAYGSSQLLSQNRSNAIVDVYHTGGTPDDDTNKFFKSLFENPTLLLIPEAKPHVRLEPIYKLLDVERQQPAKSALETYTALDFDELPPAMSVPFETAAQATTDGFIFGGIDWSAHGDRAFLSVYSDSIRNTATRRASASIHYWDKAEEWIRHASLFTPIRRGDYYKSSYWPTAGNPTGRVSMQPFELGFGDWEQISVDVNEKGRPQDGFAVVVIQAGAGARGSVTGEQDDVTMACSVHNYREHDVWIDTESFCMPVMREKPFIIKTKPTNDNPQVSAYWIPIGERYQFKSPELVGAGVASLANTNGILFGYLAADATDGPRGEAYLRVADQPEQIDQTSIGNTSVHWNRNGDKWIAYNSITRVVCKGQWFKPVVVSTSGSISSSFHWMPIVPSLKK